MFFFFGIPREKAYQPPDESREIEDIGRTEGAQAGGASTASAGASVRRTMLTTFPGTA